MPVYRKKPVTVNAVPVSSVLAYLGSPPGHAREEAMRDMEAWVVEGVEQGRVHAAIEGGEGGREVLAVNTLEGQMIGQPDDMLIRGVQGEMYPCKRDIFRATYELIGG